MWVESYIVLLFNLLNKLNIFYLSFILKKTSCNHKRKPIQTDGFFLWAIFPNENFSYLTLNYLSDIINLTQIY